MSTLKYVTRTENMQKKKKEEKKRVSTVYIIIILETFNDIIISCGYMGISYIITIQDYRT